MGIFAVFFVSLHSIVWYVSGKAHVSLRNLSYCWHRSVLVSFSKNLLKLISTVKGSRTQPSLTFSFVYECTDIFFCLRRFHRWCETKLLTPKSACWYYPHSHDFARYVRVQGGGVVEEQHVRRECDHVHWILRMCMGQWQPNNRCWRNLVDSGTYEWRDFLNVCIAQ